MTVWTWPKSVLAPRRAQPHLAERTLSGGASISGRTQVSATDAGIWTCSYDGFPVVTRDAVLTWRAIQAYLEGRLGEIDVPLFDYENAFAPYATGLDWAALLVPVPHSDGAYFSDGSGYVVGEIEDIVTASSAALRATSVTVTVNYGPTLQPGMIFEITHTSKGPRWYVVTSHEDDTGVMTFRPPLREAVGAGARMIFTNPKCRMRLAADSSMALALEMPRFGFPSVEFVESF